MLPIAITSSLLLLATAWVYRDYHAWLAFGTGGTPPNFRGYLKISKFRLLRIWAGDDLKDPSPLSATAGPQYLPSSISQRCGPAPIIISRTLPQRQQPPQVSLDAAAHGYLHGLAQKYAAQYPKKLEMELSATEGRSTDAIYAKDKQRQCGARDPVLGHEIAHVHPAENSLHIWLTQADAKKVIAAGWGERFPLASLGMVDNGWTFVYAPRDMEEVLVVETFVKAGIAHLTGEAI